MKKINLKKFSKPIAIILSAGMIGAGAGIIASEEQGAAYKESQQLGAYLSAVNDINNYANKLFNSEKAILAKYSPEGPTTLSDIGLRDVSFSASRLEITDYYNGYNADGKDPYIILGFHGSATGTNAKNKTDIYKDSQFSIRLDYDNYKYYEEICNLSSYGGVKPHWYSEEKGNYTCANEDAKMYNIYTSLDEDENIEQKTALMKAIYNAIEAGKEGKYATLGEKVEAPEKITTKLVNVGSPTINKDTISYVLTYATYDANNLSKDAKITQATLKYAMNEKLKNSPSLVYDDEIIKLMTANISDGNLLNSFNSTNKPSFSVEYNIATIKDCENILEIINNLDISPESSLDQEAAGPAL